MDLNDWSHPVTTQAKWELNCNCLHWINDTRSDSEVTLELLLTRKGMKSAWNSRRSASDIHGQTRSNSHTHVFNHELWYFRLFYFSFLGGLILLVIRKLCSIIYLVAKRSLTCVMSFCVSIMYEHWLNSSTSSFGVSWFPRVSSLSHFKNSPFLNKTTVQSLSGDNFFHKFCLQPICASADLLEVLT